METIANRIKEALEIRNLKQADLVKLTGIGKSSISTYISGAYEPKQKNIYKMAKVLGVSEAWLMGYNVPMNRDQDIEIEGGDMSLTYKELSDLYNIPAEVIKDIFLSPNFVHYLPSNGDIYGAFENIFKSRKNSKNNNVGSELIINSSKDIQQLLTNYLKLNDEGKATALDSVEALTCLPKYKKCDNSEELA